MKMIAARLFMLMIGTAGVMAFARNGVSPADARTRIAMCQMPGAPAFAQGEDAAIQDVKQTNVANVVQNGHLTSVLGVTVGMTMDQTLRQLQNRSKRFRVVPEISADAQSLNLLTWLAMSDARLGWQNGYEMVASTVRFVFYKGKVVRFSVSSDKLEECDDDYHSRSERLKFDRHKRGLGDSDDWNVFFRKVAKAKDPDAISASSAVINAIESCSIARKGDHCVVFTITDFERWAEYAEEKKCLEEFFKNVTRDDEVLD